MCIHQLYAICKSAGRVTAVEINAMLPPQGGEKQPDNQAKYLLESLLNLLVSEVENQPYEFQHSIFSHRILLKQWKRVFVLISDE